MKKLIKSLVIIISSILLFLGFSSSVNAESVVTNNPTGKVTYNLDDKEFESKKIYDANGNLQGEISVEKIYDNSSNLLSRAMLPIKYRGYTRIKYTDFVFRTMSFDVSIAPNPDRFTSAVNRNYSWKLGKVTNSTLSHTSNTARLKLFIDGVLSGSGTQTLEARITRSGIEIIKY